jgi:hypothetical protein
MSLKSLKKQLYEFLACSEEAVNSDRTGISNFKMLELADIR